LPDDLVRAPRRVAIKRAVAKPDALPGAKSV
jgi:hypothetical protein